MSIRIQNHGASTQTRGLIFTLPLARAETLGRHVDLSSGQVAHRCFSDSKKALYAVTGSWNAGNTSVTLAASSYAQEDEFDLHAAFGTAECGQVTSWDTRFVPRVYTLRNGVETEVLPGSRAQALTVRMDSPYFKEVVLSYHFNGWHLDMALRLWSGQALAEIVSSVFWSDEASPEWSTPAERLILRFGHEVAGHSWVTTNEGWVSAENGRQVYLPLTFADSTQPAPGNERGNWANRIWHGRHLTFRGHLFGRGASTIAGDEAKFLVAATLRAHGDATEWAGGWGFSGRVPAVPSVGANASAIISPSFATTDRHYVTWARGTGASSDNGSIGYAPASWNFTPGGQGGLGMVGGGQILRGYQDLRELEIAVADWGLRPRWVNRNGTYPRPSATRDKFYLHHGYPHQSSPPSTLFGKTSTSGMAPPSAGDSRDGFDTEHYSSTATTAFYRLSFDYITFRLMEDEAHYWDVASYRGGICTHGSGFGGSRSFGRTMNGLFQMMEAAPSLEGLLRNSIYNEGEGSLVHTWISNMGYRNSGDPPVFGSSTSPLGLYYWSYAQTSLLSATYNGQTFNLEIDPLWHMLGTIGIYQAYLRSGTSAANRDQRILVEYERVAASALKFGTVYLSTSPTSYAGWYLAYNLLGSRSGEPLPDAIRTQGHAQFSTFVPSAGGDDLRSWAYAGVYLYVQVGADSAARARAQQCLTAIRQGGTAARTWGQAMRECAAV